MNDLLDDVSITDLAVQAKIDALERLEGIQKLVAENTAVAKKQEVVTYKLPENHRVDPRLWLNKYDQGAFGMGIVKLLGGEAVTRAMIMPDNKAH